MTQSHESRRSADKSLVLAAFAPPNSSVTDIPHTPVDKLFDSHSPVNSCKSHPADSFDLITPS